MNRIAVPALLLLWMSGALGWAQQPDTALDRERIEDALRQARQDVKTATETLNALRQDIDSQRIPLVEQHQRLLAERNELEFEASTLQRQIRRDGRELSRLETRNREWRAERNDIQTALMEFRRVLETHAAAAQALELSSRLQKMDDAFHADSTGRLATASAELLKIAETWNRSWQIGLRFEGVALDRRDVEIEGEFVVLGPVAYFASADRQTVGPTITHPGSRMASVVPVDAEAAQAIETLLARGHAMAPVDPTGGAALLQPEKQRSFLAEVRKGGPVMYPLLAVAALALLLALLKALQLTAIHVPRREAIAEIARCVRAGQLQEAAELTGRLAWPLPDLLRVGADHRHIAREHLEEILHEQVLLKLPALERHLGTLAVLGAVAPLLGLLGTVTGMIHTFELVKRFGTGNAELLSGGISEALVTTKFGLLIAVPVLLAHALLSRRVRRAIAALENAALTFVNILKVEENRS